MTIDERLEFLRQSTESLHDSLAILTDKVAALTDKVAALTDTVALHEQQWERLRRITVAALRAALDDDGSGQPNPSN